MEKKLIVISIDSMIEDDLEILKGLPNFAEVLNSSSVVRKIGVHLSHPYTLHPHQHPDRLLPAPSRSDQQ